MLHTWKLLLETAWLCMTVKCLLRGICFQTLHFDYVLATQFNYNKIQLKTSNEEQFDLKFIADKVSFLCTVSDDPIVCVVFG